MEMLDFYKGKRVFITGHTGFKGSWLCTMLLLAGAEVTGYALPPAEPGLFQIIGLEHRMRSVQGDIRDLDFLWPHSPSSGRATVTRWGPILPMSWELFTFWSASAVAIVCGAFSM